MATTYTTDPCVLDGFQAAFKEGPKGGFALQVLNTDETLLTQLEEERERCLAWCESKLKNPKRKIMTLEPWEETDKGPVRLKFNWKPDGKPAVVDSEGTPITETLPLYNGSVVRVSFYQKPYIKPDGVTIGTKLVLLGMQVLEVKGSGGMSDGGMSAEDAASVFGKVEGYKANEPNVQSSEVEDEPDEEEMPF